MEVDLRGAVTFLFALMVVALAFSGERRNALFAAFVYWGLIHGIFTVLFTLLADGPISSQLRPVLPSDGSRHSIL